MKEWKEEHCQQQPEEIQVIGDGLLMQRRNIHEVTHKADKKAGTPAYSEWVSEAREITEAEYQMLKSIEEISAEAAIDAYTEQLIEEGVIS